MSSIAPLVSQEVEKACAEKGVKMLDAPVSGGEPKAIDKYAVYNGGWRQSCFDEVYDVLMCMGSSVVLCETLEQATQPSLLIR